MGVITPWAMNALNGGPLYDGQTLRRISGATLLGGQSATLPLPGCLDPRALQVDVGSDPLVVVSAGLAVVTTTGGPYVTGLDTAWSGSLAARHQTYSRIDVVVLEVRDTALLRDAVVRIISGTPAAVAQQPAVPATALNLGRITVPNAAGGPATVVDQRLFTAAQGGTIRVPDAAARERLGNPTTTLDYYVHQEDNGSLWRNTGSGWSRIDSPSGEVTAFAGSVVPDGWLLCNGAAVSRLTYAPLFAAIGTTFGVGNGSSTFNVPDLSTRVPVGRGGTLPTLGAAGGSATASYPLDTGTASAAINWTAGGQIYINRGGPGFGANVRSSSASAIPLTGDTSASPSGTSLVGATGPGPNMQPYIVMNYIIRT